MSLQNKVTYAEKINLLENLQQREREREREQKRERIGISFLSPPKVWKPDGKKHEGKIKFAIANQMGFIYNMLSTYSCTELNWRPRQPTLHP